MTAPIMFQMISRNNDVNGNPYRLLLVYNIEGGVIEAYEARSSMPNIKSELTRRGLSQLPTFHVQPSEYNETKKAYKDILQHCH
jgi:hypothetical protein